jgi:hypothetical protein
MESFEAISSKSFLCASGVDQSDFFEVTFFVNGQYVNHDQVAKQPRVRKKKIRYPGQVTSAQSDITTHHINGLVA